MLDIDFNNPKEILNSPRSLEACRQLGVIPNELYFQDFETYTKLNPEVKSLPKEIQKIRFDKRVILGDLPGPSFVWAFGNYKGCDQ